MHNPILTELAASGYLVHVEHHNGMTNIRIVEPKSSRQYTARGETEHMAALFAKGKVELGLADEQPLLRRAA